MTHADLARDLLVGLARARGWPEDAVERILNPAANHGCIKSDVANGLRWSVFIHPAGFLFEVARCGQEFDGPNHTSAVINDYDAVLAAAERWCTSPQLDLFGAG